jgi:alkylresorcinol/alkylpyrone synthase
MCTVLHVATAVPAHVIDQEDAKRALRPLLPVAPDRQEAALVLFDHALVKRRFSVLPLDLLLERRGVGQTMRLYREHAVALAFRAADECLRGARRPAKSIDLIITTSCTGVLIPSLESYLVERLGLRPDVRRVPIAGLGCSAGAAALGRAHDFLRGHPDAHVLVVAVELPTLSFQPRDGSIGQIVSTAIFGDGAAAVVLGQGPGLQLVDVESHLVADSQDVLGFDLRDDGFHVVLGKELPLVLRSNLAPVVARLLGRSGVRTEDLRFSAVHPGGRRILTAVEEALGLPRAVTQPAWDVLRDFGNQSSAAVLFVLARCLLGSRTGPGLLAGFGPGLAVDLGLLRWNQA